MAMKNFFIPDGKYLLNFLILMRKYNSFTNSQLIVNVNMLHQSKNSGQVFKTRIHSLVVVLNPLIDGELTKRPGSILEGTWIMKKRKVH